MTGIFLGAVGIRALLLGARERGQRNDRQEGQQQYDGGQCWSSDHSIFCALQTSQTTSCSTLPLGQIFMTRDAKRQIVGLILRQQIGLGRRVRLMASQASHRVSTLVMLVGSITSDTGCPFTGWPRPYFSGRITTLFLA